MPGSCPATGKRGPHQTRKAGDRVFAVASVVFFAVAVILDLTGIRHGTIDPETFALIGLLCLALWAVMPGWPRRP